MRFGRRRSVRTRGLDPVLEASLDGVITVDSAAVVTGWNAAAEKIFGYPRAQAIGKPLTTLIVPPAQRASHQETFARAARSGEGPMLRRRIEVSALRSDGVEIPIELCVSPIRERKGWSFCAFVRDLSGRVAAESRLQASQVRFAQLVENVPGMVYEFYRSPDGSVGFRYISGACRSIFGCEPEEFAKNNARYRISAELREEYLESIEESARTLSPWRWSGPMETDDDRIIWVEAFSRPVQEPDGTVVWYGLLLDATDHYRAVEEKEEAHLFLRAIFDQIPDILFIKDGADLRYTMFNRAGERFLGMERGKAIGKNDFDLYGPVLATKIAHEDNTALSTRKMVENEYVDRNAAGELVYTHTRKIPLFDEERGKSYLLGILTDVSEFRRLEEHLRHVNESLEKTVLLRTAELKATQQEIIIRLGRAAAYRDDETGQHIHRMARICEAVAREMGLPENDCALILAAAPMHDIGKIAVPDQILHKPDRLNEEELTVMRTHAEIGAQMLSGGSSDLLIVAETIARSHHERWDGTGYPQGLKGEEIPLAGRIAAIADVFDALTSDRPYKPAWSVSAAVEEIERGAGTHFDPTVAAAFLRALPGLLRNRLSEVHETSEGRWTTASEAA